MGPVSILYRVGGCRFNLIFISHNWSNDDAVSATSVQINRNHLSFDARFVVENSYRDS